MNSTNQDNSDNSGTSGAEIREEREFDRMDGLLDDFEEVLSTSPELFIRSYVQKGGQGWSFLLTPEFYVTAAVAGVLSGATYDGFRAIIAKVVRALHQVPGPSNPSPLEMDEDYDPTFDEVLEDSWKQAVRLAMLRNVEHSIDGAAAVHWALFTIELNQALGSVRLGRERYQRLANASAAAGKNKLSPSMLAADIIDQWLEQNQNKRDLKRNLKQTLWRRRL